jgi:predicted TIM-barrel fold metal-dependent hydrolase
MMNDPKRRMLIAGLLSTLAPLPALAKVPQLCPGDPAISDPAAPLTIDTHAHFFNGSDLQVREFLSQTTVGPGSEFYPLVKAMSNVLQTIAWHAAPNAQQERAALAKYAERLRECSGQDQLRHVSGEALQEGYALGRRELQLAAAGLEQAKTAPAILGPKDGQAGLGAAIAGLPPTLEEFEGSNAPAVLQTQPTVAGYLRFILHHFNYRHTNAIAYLSTYSRGSKRKVDLAVASMVDYDYWLARGRSTPTSLADQVDLMGDISVLLGGRVHGFAPFCPFRETMTLDATGVGDSMRLVKHAIENRGFIGVKLYPPMGFAAWGNAGKTVWKNKPTLDPVAWKPEFGARLDKAMESLFRYCQDNDVPLMAHTNDSNGPYKEFRELAGSGYWQKALEKFPGLRVSFGHFGDSDIEDHNGEDTRRFLKLMTAGAGSNGLNAFADSGFFGGVMVDQGRMRDTLLALYGAENGIMRERLMYGSDWSMILTQKNVKHYLANFIQLLRRIEEAQPGIGARQASLSDSFFGNNAAEFLGLRANRGNRKRLEAFYAKNSVAQPDWLRKVRMS